VDIQFADSDQGYELTVVTDGYLQLVTLEEAEAIAEERCSQVRDRAVSFLQYGVRERREASEDGDTCQLVIANRNGSVILLDEEGV